MNGSLSIVLNVFHLVILLIYVQWKKVWLPKSSISNLDSAIEERGNLSFVSLDTPQDGSNNLSMMESETPGSLAMVCSNDVQPMQVPINHTVEQNSKDGMCLQNSCGLSLNSGFTIPPNKRLEFLSCSHDHLMDVEARC